MEDGHAFADAIKMLRQRHFPVNYEPHPWVAGKCAIELFLNQSSDYKELFSLHLHSKMLAGIAVSRIN